MFEIGKPTLTAETRKGLPGSFVELPTGVTHYELRGDPTASAAAVNLCLVGDAPGGVR